jgi:selenocysteine-specific elongation factor
MVEEDLISNFDLPRKTEEIARDINLPAADVQAIVQELIENKLAVIIDEKRGFYYSRKNYAQLCDIVIKKLGEYHGANPTHIGMPRLQLAASISRGLDNTVFNFTVNDLIRDKKIKMSDDGKISLREFSVALDKDLKAMVDRLEKMYLSAGFQPPDYNYLMTEHEGSAELLKKAYRYLVDSGTLVFLGEGISMHKDMVAEAKDRITRFLGSKKEIRVSEFRDLINASRKYALPLLIYFDTKGVTIKRGDVRVLGTTHQP